MMAPWERAQDKRASYGEGGEGVDMEDGKEIAKCDRRSKIDGASHFALVR